jgi:hypothetical protein
MTRTLLADVAQQDTVCRLPEAFTRRPYGEPLTASHRQHPSFPTSEMRATQTLIASSVATLPGAVLR